MLLKGIILTVILVMFLLSVARQVKYKRNVRRRFQDIPVAPQESAFSLAVIELLSTAGGVYLSLLLISNFLQIDIPEQVIIAGLQLEPMAAISFVVAICQPYVLSVLHR